MQAILFDLDNTLYPPERELFSLIDKRINRYMREVVGIPAGEVDGLRRRYWADYGVTLGGLIRHWGVDPEDYLEFVHDVDVAGRLQHDAALRLMLAAAAPAPGGLHQRLARACRPGARQSSACTICSRKFSISASPPICPNPSSLLITRSWSTSACPEKCLMVEDSAANLQTAKELGMGTILVGGSAADAPGFVDVHHPHPGRAAAGARLLACTGGRLKEATRNARAPLR